MEWRTSDLRWLYGYRADPAESRDEESNHREALLSSTTWARSPEWSKDAVWILTMIVKCLGKPSSLWHGTQILKTPLSQQSINRMARKIWKVTSRSLWSRFLTLAIDFLAWPYQSYRLGSSAWLGWASSLSRTTSSISQRISLKVARLLILSACAKERIMPRITPNLRILFVMASLTWSVVHARLIQIDGRGQLQRIWVKGGESVSDHKRADGRQAKPDSISCPAAYSIAALLEDFD